MSDIENDEQDVSDDEKLLEVAHKRYNRACEVDQKNRDHALEALKFRNLEQWNPEVKNMREKDPEGARPCLVVDKTNQYLNQVINNEKMNRPSIKVRPVDDQGDPEVAEVFQGIVRHIEDASGADLAYDTAYEQAVDGGFGYFRIVSEYCDPMSFDQDLRIKRIRNRFQVLLDPDRQEPTGEDAQWGFIIDKMRRDDFKRDYPKADQMDFATDGRTFNNWVFKDYVIVAEYFYIEPKKAKICMWPDGNVTVKGSPEEAQYVGIVPVSERDTTIPTVKWKKITAKDVLDKRGLPGKYIPIIEVVGNEMDIEGERITSGLLKAAMEPQKVHNIAASNFVESIMLAPRSAWVAAEGQIEGHEELYRTANRRNISVLPYKPIVTDTGHPVPPPQRVQPAGLSVGWQQTMTNTEHDIQASMGIYAETMLGLGNANSGKQEALQQRRGDASTFQFVDNLARSVRFGGRILIDLIPHYYDTERIARILGEDGESEQAALDPNQPEAVRKVQDESGAIKKIYNLNVGKYDVQVTVGPAFATKRMEAVEWMTQMIQASPDLMKVGGDIMFRNMDAPGADEWSDRIKKTLPPGLADDNEDEPMVQTPNGPLPASKAGEVIAQLMQQAEQAAAAMQELDATKVQTEAGKVQTQQEDLALRGKVAQQDGHLKERELDLKEEELAIKRYEAETARLAAGTKDKAAYIAAEVAMRGSEAATDAATKGEQSAVPLAQPEQTAAQPV